MATQTMKTAHEPNRAAPGPDAEAAEAQRGTAARTYRTVLDNRARALTGRPILEAIETEQRDLAKCDDKIRPRRAGHPLTSTPPHPRRRGRSLPTQVRALRQQAQGALDALDRNPGLLAGLLDPEYHHHPRRRGEWPGYVAVGSTGTDPPDAPRSRAWAARGPQGSGRRGAGPRDGQRGTPGARGARGGGAGEAGRCPRRSRRPRHAAPTAPRRRCAMRTRHMVRSRRST